MATNEDAKKAYDRLRQMADALTINETARIAGRTSRWAPVAGAQYAQVNKDVDKDMVKSVWPGVTDDHIKKGRLKTTSCNVPEIQANAEHIYVDVMGQPLHHNDCPFWFAKMLYMQFVLGIPVDFSSRPPHLHVEDIRSESITIPRAELRLALSGASMEIHEKVDELQTQLQQATQRGSQQATQEQPESSASRETLNEMKELNKRLRTMQEQQQRPHPMAQLLHPNTIENLTTENSMLISCGFCQYLFHGWSGYYVLPCGCMFHLSCLVESMLQSPKCFLCKKDLPKNLYMTFNMGEEYDRLVPNLSGISLGGFGLSL